MIPVFPLSKVLFPGLLLPLHIFEERYKLMIKFCLDTGSGFGVFLIEDGMEALGVLAKPYTIGTLARILSVEKLEDGKMNLLCVGEERQMILSLDDSLPYLRAQMRDFPRSETSLPDGSSIEKLRKTVDLYFRLLSEKTGKSFVTGNLPENDMLYIHFMADFIPVPSPVKQKLLEMNSLSEMSRELEILYRRQYDILGAVSEKKGPPDEYGYSLN